MKTLIMPLRKSGFIALLVLSFLSESNARTYYSRQSGLWSVNTSWSTVTYGSPVNAGTFPQRGDVVFIGDGHNISMNVNSVTASITIGQGSSGSLLYSNYLTFLMVVAGNITVNSGAAFGYASNSSRMHNLFISGSIINNGSVDLYVDANDYVNVTFNSAINSVISGTGSWDLNRVTVFKSTLISYRLEATVLAFETAIRELVVGFGTYVHNNRFTYNVNPALGDFTVGPNAIIQVMDGVLHLSPNSNYVYLQGQITVTAGTMRIGSATGNFGLRYDQSGAGIPAIDVTGGTLSVYGGITYRSGNSGDPLRFSQSGGNVLLNSGSTGTNLEVFNVGNSASSRFTMSAGTITLQKPGSGAGLTDFNICGTSGTVTVSGGTVVFGNASTASGSTFKFTPYGTVNHPNFRVSGPAAAIVTLCPVANSTSDFRVMSLNIDANKIFDNRSVSGTTGDSRNIILTDNFDGLHAFYNNGTFTPRTGTITLQGGEGLWIGGSSTTSFYNLTLNNSMGSNLTQTIQISNTLLMLDGVMFSSAATPVVCLAGAASNIGSSISYVDGPMQQLVASSSAQSINFPVGKNGAYRPIILAVQHSSVATVTYTSEVWNNSARAMGYSLPPTLTWVSDIRHYTITRSAVANLSNARVTLSYGADDFVTDFSNLRVARDNGASAWLDLGGVGTANGTGSITSANFNGFNNYFTLANASGGVNPLPVEFVKFNGLAQGNLVMLDWTTATEVNSDFFEVQRSGDGHEFIPIGRVMAKGFSNSISDYQFKDVQPLKGMSYYRLRQVDRDGTDEFTNIVAVNFTKSTLSVFPNPVADKIIRMVLPEQENGVLVANLFDMTGKNVQYIGNVLTDGYSRQFQIDASLLPGTYLLKVSDGKGQEWQEKVVLTF
ncbi:MAG: T9SS type A sorting domain-containing protein [Bacteroidetes bacterium]|nr:T9SS type A sorting domain-containing protein [Bacteroidota bacterium]